MDPFTAGLASSFAGSALDFGFGQASSAISWKRQKKILQNQVRWRVNDMRKAGINPILAVSGGFGGGGAAVPPGATGGHTDFAASARSMQEAMRSRKLQNAELDLLNAQTSAATSQELRNRMEAILSGARAGKTALESIGLSANVPEWLLRKEHYSSARGREDFLQRMRIEDQGIGKGVVGAGVAGVSGIVRQLVDGLKSHTSASDLEDTVNRVLRGGLLDPKTGEKHSTYGKKEKK